MNNMVNKRLANVEKELYRNVWADITYKDGTKKRLKLVETINLYLNNDTPPDIINVSIIGNTDNQGILPELLKYLVSTSQ